jgi:hypothetical protein
MRFTRRGSSSSAYPLPVGADIHWQAIEGGYQTSVDLPPCPAGHIIVPSLSMTGAPFRFQFELKIPGSDPVQLNAVPAEKAAPQPAAGAPVSTHIDCYHTREDLPASRLLVSVDRLSEPWLLTLSIRCVEQPQIKPQPMQVQAHPPLPISQMQGPEKIRGGICSPTSMAMLLNRPERDGWLDFVEACRDSVTGMYGVWPLAVRAAGLANRLGAVEVFSDWSEVLPVFNAGLPMVASIRFAENKLPGAPLTKTSGHLVVVYGVDGEEVLILDPAASDHNEVARRYPLQAFTDAWFAHRGAGYILAA